MDLFISYYQLILIPLWPVLWDYKVPIFEVPIMSTFTNSDAVRKQVHSFVVELIKFSSMLTFFVLAAPPSSIR